MRNGYQLMPCWRLSQLSTDIPQAGDKRGQDELLLKKYLWHAFFTDRYENAAATRAYADFVALKKVICEEQSDRHIPFSSGDVPLFKDYKIADVEELMTADWPKRASIRGRGFLPLPAGLVRLISQQANAWILTILHNVTITTYFLMRY